MNSSLSLRKQSLRVSGKGKFLAGKQPRKKTSQSWQACVQGTAGMTSPTAKKREQDIESCCVWEHDNRPMTTLWVYKTRCGDSAVCQGYLLRAIQTQERCTAFTMFSVSRLKIILMGRRNSFWGMLT